MMVLAFSGDLLSRKTQVALEEEFASLDAMVRRAFAIAAYIAWVLFGRRLVITSMRRPEGNHASGRMIDYDVDEGRQYGGLPPEEAQVLVDMLNLTLVYDPDPRRPHFPVAVYGKNDSSGKHWDHTHLQVCYGDGTKFRRRDSIARWDANLASLGAREI